MTDPIDDRRRFRELWKELVFARVAAGFVSGSAVALVVAPHYLVQRRAADALETVVVFTLFAVFVAAAPSGIAKRGAGSFVLVSAAVLAGVLCAYAGSWMAGRAGPGPVAVLASLGAAIGLSEGLAEKSIATTYCGLLGGTATGAILGLVVAAWAIVSAEGEFSLLGVGSAFAVLQVAIGLSLALGRWIRDRPRRKAGAAGD